MMDQYVELLADLLTKIDAIDDNTQWQASEPAWWLHMMALRQAAQAYLDENDELTTETAPLSHSTRGT